jgi:pyruvate dehydrogenase E1 component alpha subunit
MRLLIVRNFPMVTSKHHWEDEMATRKSATAASRKKPAEKSGLNGGITEFDKETELEAYREMLLIRRFEEKAGQLYGMGFIGGFCHLYIGQEAVVVGMQMALKDGDQVITGYRDHGHMLATGMEARGVMAELTGRQGGYSRGKGGSMHMFSKDKNFYGGHGIVGAQVSLGTGLAFANKYRGNDNVSWPISAMARPTRARSTRVSTWRRFGSCR